MSKIIEAVLTELQKCDTTDEVEQFVTRQAERIERLEAENAELRRRVEANEYSEAPASTESGQAQP